jgi:hypothetical protein
MKLLPAIVCAGLAISMGGCATLARGMHQSFAVETTPPGAKITTSNGLGCEAMP